MVQEKWLLFKGEQNYSLHIWHGCLQSMRKYLRGWSLQLLGDQRKGKVDLSQRIQELDKIAESRLLSIQEWEERIEIEVTLENINSNRAEELQWKQKARIKWLLEGDSNSHFFTSLLMEGGRIPSLFLILILGKLEARKRLLTILFLFTKTCLVIALIVPSLWGITSGGARLRAPVWPQV